jgi:hypothetical protein
MNHKIQYIFLMGIISCSTINEVVNPLQNPLTSWIFDKSCISVDIPPITLTSEKTAIEKQILGEKTEISPDGWLIISPNYVANFEPQSAIEPELKKNLFTLSLYKDAVEYYIIREYIGIDEKGNLLVVPEKLRNFNDYKHIRVAKELIDIMNQNKNIIYQYYLQKDKKIAEDFINQYIKTFQSLGWNYDSKMGWYKK